MADFNFDAWSALARTSPEEFERQRRMAIDGLITAASDVHQLQVMQWRIDAERTRARTPLKSCLRLSSLMWDAFFDFREVLDTPAKAANYASKTAEHLPASTGAQIIPFRNPAE